MIRNFSAEGLIIKHKNLGEADKIITIFSKEKEDFGCSERCSEG